MKHEVHAKKLFACQILQGKANGTTSSTTEMLLFWQRKKDNPQRVLRQKRSWVRNLSMRLYYFIVSLIITLRFQCTLYLIQNEGSKKKKGNIKCFLRCLGLDPIYKFFVCFIFNILSVSYINAMFFINVVWKLSVDLKTQESEVLKGVYSLQFFYLAEDEKLFFTQWYANGKDITVCGHENSDIGNDHCPFCFGKYSHDGNEGWIQYPAWCQQWFNEQCFYN